MVALLRFAGIEDEHRAIRILERDHHEVAELECARVPAYPSFTCTKKTDISADLWYDGGAGQD